MMLGANFILTRGPNGSAARYGPGAQRTSDAPGLEIFAVFFDAGARTIPHTHSTDQLLYFLEGEGVVGTLDSAVVTGPVAWPSSRRTMALARGDAHVNNLSPVDPTGWSLGLGPRRAHARLGHLHGRGGRGRMIARADGSRSPATPRPDRYGSSRHLGLEQ